MQAPLLLYRSLIKEGRKFKDYNIRSYILRRATEEFQKYASEADSNKISELVSEGNRQLAILRR
jgi:hypothetical protein